MDVINPEQVSAHFECIHFGFLGLITFSDNRLVLPRRPAPVQ